MLFWVVLYGIYYHRAFFESIILHHAPFKFCRLLQVMFLFQNVYKLAVLPLLYKSTNDIVIACTVLGSIFSSPACGKLFALAMFLPTFYIFHAHFVSFYDVYTLVELGYSGACLRLSILCIFL